VTRRNIDRLMAVVGFPNRILWRFGSPALAYLYWRFTCRLWAWLYRRAGV